MILFTYFKYLKSIFKYLLSNPVGVITPVELGAIWVFPTFALALEMLSIS